MTNPIAHIGPKFILSGGGTGGHIFPAVAIAKELQLRFPKAEFLFVGALGKMEMEKVPKEGFQIVGLPIEGLKRSASLRNIVVFFKTLQSFWKARKILKAFQPTAVIGTGGYASLPICFMAARGGYPTFLQEQNGFAGLTNRLVAVRAKQIFTGFPNMDQFFPARNWEFTGNPVRQNIIDLGLKKQPDQPPQDLNQQATVYDQQYTKQAQDQQASNIEGPGTNRSRIGSLEKFEGLKPNLPVVFITGGSLGARTINQTIFNNLIPLAKANIQLIWQMGLPFAKSHTEQIYKVIIDNPDIFQTENAPGIFFAPFIYNMDDAYQAADIVISRAGAISISEIAVVGKPSILVPSPNVTDDHQTQNAKVLSSMDAAMLITDKQAPENLVPAAIALIKDTKKQVEMQEKLKQIAKPHATQTIVNRIVSCLKINE